MAIAKEELDQQAEKQAWISRELAKVGQRYLTAMAMVFSLFYGLRGLAFLYSPGGVAGGKLGGFALLSAGIGGTLYYHAKRRAFSATAIELCFFLLCAMLLFNTCWAYVMKFNNELTPNFAFVAIAVGLGTINFRVWVAQLALIVGLYAAILVTVGPPDGRPFYFYLVSGLALSFLSFQARIAVVRERVTLDYELMEKAKKLEAANKAKDRFLANMTHDLRTPMTGVLGMMELLRETRLTKEQGRLLETAKTSAGYLLAIINDILDYSKLESGKFKLKPAPTDVLAITSDIVEMLRPQATVKGIEMELSLPEDEELWVTIDGVRIGQVLFNLVGNAIKFTEKGGVTVRLRTEQRGGQHHLSWAVRDTGAGIPRERLPKLFERFEQLDSSVTRQQGGTGLGLAIIKELLDLMDGLVEVESVIGEGTEFRFTVPASLCAPMAWVDEGADMPPKAPDLPLKVLVAEDNPINRALIEKLLEKLGWQVQIVENGEAAVAAVTKTEEPFDLVLMDVQMPVMDGLTATGVLFEKMKNPPPIIALTANTMKDDVEAYLAAGMKGHIGKPIDMDELRATISRVISEEASKKTE
ncbi:MAG: response regulator [Alphaproteobacteria bacterium]|nr:response regulator [Alphaproteobacteria bacterium]